MIYQRIKNDTTQKMTATIREDHMHMPVTETTPLVVSPDIPLGNDERLRDQNLLPNYGESIVDDVLDTLKLGVPIAISYLSWVGVSQ